MVISANLTCNFFAKMIIIAITVPILHVCDLVTGKGYHHHENGYQHHTTLITFQAKV